MKRPAYRSWPDGPYPMAGGMVAELLHQERQTLVSMVRFVGGRPVETKRTVLRWRRRRRVPGTP